VYILLVEDNDAVRKAYKDALELLGHEVRDAANGHDALLLIQGLRKKLDLIISDLVMPKMNALQLHDALEQRQEGVRMLIITGYPMPSAGETLARRPKVNWAHKPMGLDELRELVTMYALAQ